MNDLRVQVGDRVVIAKPASSDHMAPWVERVSFVTAVRAKSFDAGGLCFRLNGQGWNGRHYLLGAAGNRETPFPKHTTEETKTQERLPFGSGLIPCVPPSREAVVLAFLLADQPEEEWLSLGVLELRRIAAMLGVVSSTTRTSNPSQALSINEPNVASAANPTT